MSSSALRLSLLSILALAFAAASAQGAQVSSNWAGYVATGPAGAASRFSSVSGTWTQPTATCSASRASYSAVWVGLGGARENAHGLEQVGTDADCTHSGRAIYQSWFELLPAEAIAVPLAVHPGDRMTASVTVRGQRATLRLRNLSTAKRFTVTRRVTSLDVSSAEWIVEAPSLCAGTRSCTTEALTNFSQVAFSAASATAHGHTGAIADPAWGTTALELRQSLSPSGHQSATAVGVHSHALILATPTAASSSEGAFAVRWQEQAVQGERATAPTLPGASGAGG